MTSTLQQINHSVAHPSLMPSPAGLICKDRLKRAPHAQPSLSALLKVKFSAACMLGSTDVNWSIQSCLRTVLPPPAQISYLCLEAFHQNGNQKVEEHVIAKGHQGHKVERCPWRCWCHSIVQDHIPVLLSEDLQRGEGEDSDYSTPLMHSRSNQFLADILIPSFPSDLF